MPRYVSDKDIVRGTVKGALLGIAFQCLPQLIPEEEFNRIMEKGEQHIWGAVFGISYGFIVSFIIAWRYLYQSKYPAGFGILHNLRIALASATVCGFFGSHYWSIFAGERNENATTMLKFFGIFLGAIAGASAEWLLGRTKQPNTSK